jgi:hypothetical protein
VPWSAHEFPVLLFAFWLLQFAFCLGLGSLHAAEGERKSNAKGKLQKAKEKKLADWAARALPTQQIHSNQISTS